jgi:hypothetical protein
MRSLTTRYLAALSLLVLPALAGCITESDAYATWDGTMRDSAGVTIVENFGTPVITDPDSLRFVEEVLRIGTAMGDPDYQFGRITGYAVLSDGRIVIADALGHHLKFFSPDGTLLLTMGKHGSGPAEFGRGNLLVMRAAGDTLIVPDWGNMQAHRIAPDGTWLGSFSMRPQDGYYIAGWDDVPSGRVVSLLSAISTPDAPALDTMDAVVVRDAHGAFLDTLARVPTSRFVTFRGGDPQWHFYAGRPDFDLRWNGGIVTGRSDEFRLQWHDDDGRLERIVTLHRPRLPMTATDQTILMDVIDRTLRNAQVPSTRVSELKSRVSFESEYPTFRRFVCGPAGTLFVQQIRPLSDLDEDERDALEISDRPPVSRDWDVFDAQGRYLGVLRWPPNFFGYRFEWDADTGTWINYGQYRDELDVEYLAAWRVAGLPAP